MIPLSILCGEYNISDTTKSMIVLGSRNGLGLQRANRPPRLHDFGVVRPSGIFGEDAKFVLQGVNELLHSLLPCRSFLQEAAQSTAVAPRPWCTRTSAAALRVFSSLRAFSSGLMISRPFASRATGAAPSPAASSASWSADFISRASDSCPIRGAKRSPPKMAPKTSSGSTKPPSGALSFDPNSLYLCRSWGSERVW